MHPRPMTPQYTEASQDTFYWVFPAGNPWSLSLLDEPQANE
jgi:hypothetical protein